MLRFFTVSYTHELPDTRQIEEFLFEGTTVGGRIDLQTTQDPMRYGGPVFHTSTAVARILKAARKDARFTGTQMQVRPLGERRNPLGEEQLTLLQREQLLKVLDAEELRILSVT